MATREELVARHLRRVAAGTVLFREGERAEHVYVVHGGRVRITRGASHHEVVLAELGVGELFGEMAVLNGTPRTATAVVTEDAALVVLAAEKFGEILEHSPEIAMLTIRRLAKRLEAANALVDVLVEADPRVRALLAISRAAERALAPLADGAVEVPFEAGSFAHQVGVAEDDVEALLARLARLRLVEPRPTSLAIPAVGRLREFLEFLRARHHEEGA